MFESSRRSARAMAILGLGLMACGPGTSGSSSTCYDTFVAAAQGCLPPASSVGVMNDAGTECAYPSGAQVTFSLPESDGLSNFVLDSAGGALCLSYSDIDGGFRTLTTSAGTATFSLGTVTCPNGIEYTGTTPFGNVSAYGAGSASFDLVTSDGGVEAFNCEAS